MEKEDIKPRQYRNNLHRFLAQFFCQHKWQMIGDPNEMTPAIEPGTMMIYIRLHICPKCSKEKDIGSGIML